jgi:tyrosine-specific transport protein
MNSKLLGGILLVIGTTIGAGMLALPVTTGQLGFWGSALQLVSCWVAMVVCALLFLEVNLWLPANSNLVSMAGATLGRAGQALAWVVYLVLLYSIISAYISGGGDLFHYVLTTAGLQISPAIGSILFTLLFGLVVYFGIRAVDYVNRGLMFGKLGAFLLLTAFIVPFISIDNLTRLQMKYIVSPTGIMVTAVAFGSLMIIPSLRSYFGEDIKSLRKAIVIGTFIPLLCYIAWDMVIMGVVPLNGTPGLNAILNSANPNSGVVAALTSLLQKPIITDLAKFFLSICMTTSFLSVSLSLSDFLSDGLNMPKEGIKGSALVFGGTFLPPLILVLFYPNAFLSGLKFAGLSIFILMVLMPPLMAWRGRYHHELVSDVYQVRGGKFLLATLLVFAVLMVGFALQSII